MPFLVPALTALSSDVIILWLNTRAPVESVFANSSAFYNVGYLPWLSISRLFLLLIPLLFHSYTGTALRNPRFYKFWYGITGICVIIHMLGLALINPQSLEAIFPLEAVGGGIRRVLRALLENMHELRRIWWMLNLSLLSILCHVVVVLHVRSTAPLPAYYGYDSRGGMKKLPTVYFAVRAASIHDGGGDGTANHHDEPALIHAMNDFVIDMQAKFQRAQSEWVHRIEELGQKISHHPGVVQQVSSSSTHGNNSGTPPTTGATAKSSSSLGGAGAVVASSKSSSSNLTPFRVLLQLFAYEDVLENGKLDGVFDVDHGESLIFYVPQLLSFLLHGALYSSPVLEEWILDKCTINVHFAHRCYWFLRAWCLEVPAEARCMSRVHSSNNSLAGSLTNGTVGGDSASFGGNTAGLAPFLDEPVAFEENHHNSLQTICRPSSHHHQQQQQAVAMSSTLSLTLEDDKFLPEERAMIERLMMRVKESGEAPARTLEVGAPASATARSRTPSNSSRGLGGIFPEDAPTPVRHGGSGQDHHDDDDNNNSNSIHMNYSNVSGGDNHSNENGAEQVQQEEEEPRVTLVSISNGYDTSPAAMVAAAEEGKIPVDPGTGYPSVKHFDAMVSPAHGFRSTLEVAMGNSQPHHQYHLSPTENFDKTPQFLDALIFLAENLFLIPREERRETLRQQLRALECELLPSNAVYLPIGNHNHRVWRIVSEESVPINTKERVPCIIPLEVVDYSPKRREGYARSWNLLDRLPNRRRIQSTDSGLFAEKPEEPVDAPTDTEILAEWRFARRPSRRRVSLLDKMTTTVKVPFDKMKDHFNQMRERGSIHEEMQSLPLTEYLFEPEPRQDPLSNAEHGKTNGLDEDTTSVQSLTSLGQWSSPPNASRSFDDHRNEGNGHLRQDLNDLRSRLHSQLPDNKSRSSPLPYGSDHEDDPVERKEKRRSKRPPIPKVVSNDAADTQQQQMVAVKKKRTPPVVFRESWESKQERVRKRSAFGRDPGWRLLPILIKANDDLRQEQLAAQLIQRMATILARERVAVWLCPYEILALTDRGGVIEAIPDTISIDSLKKNLPGFTNLRDFFQSHYGEGTDELAAAKANFVESLAAYSMVCFLLQLKDRHNGNILLDTWGHLIHIDFGFFFLSSPGKNVGFESAPFKLTRDFVEVLDGPESHLFRTFRDLCVKTFITLRRHCMEIILLVEMLKNGNEELQCFRGRPDDAIRQLRERFRLDLNDRACKEYVNSLVDASIENWRTDWYDRYQRYFVGVL